MPLLTDHHHDLAHPVENDPAWGESYFFYAYDAAADVGFWGGVRLRQNEGVSAGALYVMLPGGRTAKYEEEIPYVDNGVHDDLAIGGVRLEMLDPMGEWRIHGQLKVQELDADENDLGTLDIELDAYYSALIPAIGTDGQRAKASSNVTESSGKMLGKGHFDQPGQWTGTIRVDGTPWTFRPERALGGRDKSWGARRWHQPDAWRWLAINIDHATHFGGFYMSIDEGELHRGWTWVDDQFTSLSSWSFRSEFAEDGYTPLKSFVTIQDKKGRIHEIDGEIRSIFRLRPAPGTLLMTCLVRWTHEGRTGSGLTDFLYQMRDGKPVLVVHQESAP